MDTLQLNELLECSVCLERLEDNCKVLPCQHTFCLRCLKQIVASRKELRCPECRILVTEDVDDLPTNILLVRILEGLKRQKDIKNKAKENSAESSSFKKENKEECATSSNKEPTAKALYDYEPQEQGDLVLKKGQIIELIRQVDTNWYEGKIDGQQGFLPANYVEILVPLSNFDDSVNRGPVARALYDFEDPEEKDLLSFKQGGMIQVIRRVDENWCEGRIDNIYGIFPINFVEFNDAARSIIFAQNSELLAHAPWDQAVQVRPSRRSKPLREIKRHTIHGEARQQFSTQNGTVPNRHSVDVTCSERFEMFCNEALSSSQAVRTNGSSATELSRTAEDVPSTSRTNATDDESPSISLPPSNGHSRQSSRESPPPSDHSRQSSEDRSLETSSAPSTSTGERTDSRTDSRTDNGSNGPRQNGIAERPRTSSRTTSSDSTNPPSKQRHGSASSSNPELFTALYNYRAQKDDEIDLHQGDSYHVVEKCRDGWFRGKSVKSNKSGVFPGNYVKLSSADSSSAQEQQPSTNAVNVRSRRLAPTPSGVPAPVVRQRSDVTGLSVSIVAPNERLAPHSQPPPPPAFRNSPQGPSTGFLRKFSIGKKKERSKPMMPPPPAYRRHPPASFRQEGANISLFGPSPHTPPPPYTSRSTAGQLSRSQSSRPSRQPSSQNRERCRVVVAYPPQSSSELELRVGDIVYVFRKHDDGWYKGTLERNGKTGLFPGSFVEKF